MQDGQSALFFTLGFIVLVGLALFLFGKRNR
ncbi:LPXTG cell wall anchor domain-containing protein [Streptomyces sp. NPDC092369]